MKYFLTAVKVLIITLAAFGQSAESISKIDSIRTDMQRLAEQNQLAKAAMFYTGNAVVNGSDATLQGKEEIENYWKNLHGEGVRWEWKNLSYSGNDALITQTGISLLTLRYGHRKVTHSSQFSVVWERQADRSYKIASDFYRPYEYSKPAKYEVVRDSVWVPSGEDMLFGVLLRPKVKKGVSMPAALFLQGGGDVGLTNYLYEAEYFAENGFVALVCDKAGSGLSEGGSSWTTQTFNDKIREYYNILRWLKEHSLTDSSKVGVHGLSEGGRLALALAARYPGEISYINAVAGPIESFKNNQLYAIHNLLESRNIAYPTIIKVLQVWDQYFDEIATGSISQEVIDRANIIRSETEVRYLPGNTTELPTRPHPEDIHFTLEGSLSAIQTPVFLQYGEDDRRVNTQKSISLLPDSENFTIKVYPNTNHSMITSGNKVHPEYLEDKLDWLKMVLENSRQK